MTLRVVLLTQAPCTAGTFITKYVSSILSPNCLISEANPWWISVLDNRSFSPLCPAALPVVHGKLNESDHLAIYSSALDEFFRIARARSFDLITIRDHLFSEFFISQQWKLNGPSYRPFWVEYLLSRGIDFRVIFTVRHPFDSYVSLCYSFPTLACKLSLESYSQCYLQALASFKRASNPMFLSVESLADLRESHPVLLELKAWTAGRAADSADLPQCGSWESSGDSGRSASEPAKFPRRRFSTTLRVQALTSTSFPLLCSELGYNYCKSTFSCSAVVSKSLLSDCELTLRSLPGCSRLLDHFGLAAPSSQP